ncbi:ABC transporter permease [Benzoatithermus flavus]|uniref:ABC transporter permease n=1 Tax=Benzoatithermus flavus TaxID=3108223 RepID=A0ABU8XRM0_9PROT
MSTVIERLGVEAGTGPATTAPARLLRHPLVLGLLLPLGAAAAWELAARAGWIEARLLPPPSVVARAIVELQQSGDLARHTTATLARVAAGFALGLALATGLGALAGFSATARRLLDPTLQALRAIPSIAWVPLFVLWFGIFEASKVALIATGAFFPIYLSLVTGIQGVDRKLVEVGRVCQLGPLALIGRILIPAALPAWLTGVRGGLGLAWMFVIAAELMGASEGLGYLLVDGQMTGNAAQILAALVLFALLGQATDALLVLLTRRLVAWQDSFAKAG